MANFDPHTRSLKLTFSTVDYLCEMTSHVKFGSSPFIEISGEMGGSKFLPT